jgi:hypothetical protein
MHAHGCCSEARRPPYWPRSVCYFSAVQNSRSNVSLISLLDKYDHKFLPKATKTTRKSYATRCCLSPEREISWRLSRRSLHSLSHSAILTFLFIILIAQIRGKDSIYQGFRAYDTSLHPRQHFLLNKIGCVPRWCQTLSTWSGNWRGNWSPKATQYPVIANSLREHHRSVLEHIQYWLRRNQTIYYREKLDNESGGYHQYAPVSKEEENWDGWETVVENGKEERNEESLRICYYFNGNNMSWWLSIIMM